MQLMNVWDNLREQSVFKREETQATSERENAIIAVFQNISHENIENRRNHKVSLLLNEALKVWSDECWQSWQNRAQS